MTPNIDYKEISLSLNEFANEMMVKVQEQYANFKIKKEDIPLKDFIIVDEPTVEDIAFFSKQNGSEFSIENVPAAHGGRAKGDGKVHIYPYSPDSFSQCKSTEEIIEICKRDIIIHEIFHYFIRPNIDYPEDSIEAEFAHFITEGLVDGYAMAFAQNNNLVEPNSNYHKNTEYAHRLLCGMPEEVDRASIVFNSPFSQMINLSQTSGELLTEYREHKSFYTKVNDLIDRSAPKAGYTKEGIKGIKRYYANMDDKHQVLSDLADRIQTLLGDDPAIQDFVDEIASIETDTDGRKEKTETHAEDGLKLVRTMPDVSNNSSDASSNGSDGKINYLIIIGGSIVLLLIALIGIYIINIK